MEEEKRGSSASIQACCFLGRCHARWGSRAFREGMNGPQLSFLASWGGPTPESLDSLPWERTHRGGGFSLLLFFYKRSTS